MDDITGTFRKAAKKAVQKWTTMMEAADVENELWTWYLGNPSVVRRMDGYDADEALKIAITEAHRICSGDVKASYVASGNAYSSEDVKAALRGESACDDLRRKLPIAMQQLRDRNPGYAEALELRYYEGRIPEDKRDQNRLVNGHKALTDEVNKVSRQAMRAEADREDSKKTYASPEGRRPPGEVGDPTADLAFAAMSSPEARELLYAEPSLDIPIVRITEPTPSVSMSIFDYELDGMPGLNSYRASVVPDLYPHERPNWFQGVSE